MSAMPWLAAVGLLPDDAILVTVASVEGSVPRETGAGMLVTATHATGTIGGGHLEFCAIGLAREMLRSSASSTDASHLLENHRRLERLPLGPTLGQCCGGVVYLAFERIVPTAFADAAMLTQRWQRGLDTWRVVPLDSTMPPVLIDRQGAGLGALGSSNPALPCFDRDQPCHLLRDADGKRWLIDPCLPYRSQLLLFGAGHVGAAIVRALAELPCRVTWIDERAELFPETVPENATIEVTDSPEAMVDSAPAGASFLVMTHSHRLDQRLAERILARTGSGWFGLIGSHTKRIQFERRLRARGIAEDRIDDMVCPIGIDGIDGKAPAIIAIAVAAQLLQVWEQQAAVHQASDQRAQAAAR